MKNDPGIINHVTNLTYSDPPNVFEEFNKRTTIDDVANWLEAKGHKATSRSPSRIEFCRAGKDGGQSFNVVMKDGVPLTYNHSTNSGLPNGKGLNPSQLKCYLDYGNLETESYRKFAADLKGEAHPPTKAVGGGNDAPPREFTWYTARELSFKDCRRDWFIKRFMTRNEPMGVIASEKGMKTTITLDLVISVAAGLPFLNFENFSVPKKAKVAFYSAESGDATIKESAIRICRSKGITFESLEDDLIFCFDVPILNLDGPKMAEDLAKRGIELVVIDPFYLALGDVDARNLFEVGAVLREVRYHLHQKGISVVIVHHANRASAPGRGNDFRPLELSDISHAGIGQWARQFLLLSRRENYGMDGHHRLFFKFGGSAGHGGLYNCDIFEGVIEEDFTGRVWEVSLTSWADAKATRADAKETKAKAALIASKNKVLDAIDAIVKDEKHPTIGAIRTHTGMGNDAVKLAVEVLMSELTIVCRTAKVETGNKAKQAYAEYVRTPPPAETATFKFGESANGCTGVKNDISDTNTAVDAGGKANGCTAPPCKGGANTDVPSSPAKGRQSSPSKKPKTNTPVRRKRGAA
jgi:hypothetical protein